VSHRWEDPSSPDLAGKQLAAIQEHLRSNPHITHVWYDYWCMPQKKDKDSDDRTEAERVEFSSMLSCIADLYLTTNVLILLDNSYVGRFWTMMEAWCSMQVTIPQGVRACGSNAEKRYTIKCIWNADDEFDTPKLVKMLATKTPEEMYVILSSPDVVLTNAKDKDLMLPVVSKTNAHVKQLFERADVLAKQEDAKAKASKAVKELVQMAEAAVAAMGEAKTAGVTAETLQAILTEGCAESTALKAIAAGLAQPSSAPQSSRPASARRLDAARKLDAALATGAAALATPSSKEPPVALGNIPQEQLLHYKALFHSNEEAPGDGLMDDTAARLLSQTGLPEKTLSDIWDLSCEIEDGPLELDGFCVAMHLASRCKMGERLPPALPPSLRPPFV